MLSLWVRPGRCWHGRIGVLLGRGDRRQPALGGELLVTNRADRSVRAAIASTPETKWIAIRYMQAVWDDEGQYWISAAEVAEISFSLGAHTPAASRPPGPRRRPVGRDRAVRHGGVTPPFPLPTPTAPPQACVIEQTFADLIDGPPHLPSGRFAANTAGLTCAGITHNLLGAPPAPSPTAILPYVSTDARGRADMTEGRPREGLHLVGGEPSRSARLALDRWLPSVVQQVAGVGRGRAAG